MFNQLLIPVPVIIASFLWVMDGARLSFWATSKAIKEEIPIVAGMPELGTQTKITWEDQFIHGIETPILGVLIMFALLLVTYLQKKKFEKSIQIDGNK